MLQYLPGWHGRCGLSEILSEFANARRPDHGEPVRACKTSSNLAERMSSSLTYKTMMLPRPVYPDIREMRSFEKDLHSTLHRRVCLCSLILEIDAQTIAARVTMRGAEGEVPLAEQVLPRT